MVTKEQAQLMVYRRINEPDPYWPDRPEIVVLESETIEKPWGWVFFYQSKAHLDSGDCRDALGGNAPYIVNRQTGKMVCTGTAYPIEHYIHLYEDGQLPED